MNKWRHRHDAASARENKICLLRSNALVGRLIVTQRYHPDFAASFMSSPHCERVPSQAVGMR
ncbi:MAG: hypothetical protein ACI9P3_004056 [Bradyrhizobium sp.]|jgi:hypothetical protein